MALNLDDLVEFAKRRILAGMAPGSPSADIDLEVMANVPAASNLAATRVMRNGALRPRLQQVYSVSLDSSGIGDLSTATGSMTGAPDEILLEGISLGSVIDNNGVVVVPLPQYTDFISPQPTVFPYYHINSQKQILTRAVSNQVYTANDIQSGAGPLSIRASFNPSDLQYWPSECQTDLVNALVEITLAKVLAGTPVAT